MRVIHVIAPGPLAGAEKVVLVGAQAQLAQGLHPQVVILHETRCPEHAQRFAELATARQIPVHSVPVTARLDVTALEALRVMLCRAQADVFHVHGHKALTYTLTAAFGLAAPIIASHHGDTDHTRAVRVYGALGRWLYGRLARVIAVSTQSATDLVATGVTAQRISVVPNPVELDVLPKVARAAQGSLKLLFLGRLSREKGGETLLRALSRHDHTRRELQLSFAGDGPMRAEWEALSDQLGLSTRVSFLGRRADVPELLAESDLVVLPSWREGMPLALLEALASGVPVFASAVGGVTQVLRGNPAGRLLPAGDVDSWVDALNQLPESLPQLRHAALSGAAELRATYSTARWADEVSRCYREVVTEYGLDRLRG